MNKSDLERIKQGNYTHEDVLNLIAEVERWHDISDQLCRYAGCSESDGVDCTCAREQHEDYEAAYKALREWEAE